jgi:DNA helicase-2/ATP-dependent DNA helicase PcrA
MIALTEAQEKVVTADLGGAIQVLASAGSGKTRVLTERVRHIITSTKKGGVIALTFTNKAAEEMQERLGDTESVEDKVWVSTIHALAQRIIEQYGHTIGLPSELHIYDRDKDRMEVFLQSLRDDGVDIDDYLDVADTRQKRDRQRVVQNYMDVFSTIKRELLSEEEVNQKFPDSTRVWKIYQDYQNALLASGGIDYDDILIYAHRILLTQEWVANIYRAKYKHLCVDEAQDLNKAQYEFIKAFCGDVICSILMVGDPHQMIYGFNGSSSQYLCSNFVIDFSPKQFELKENYRSSKSVIDAANKLKPNSQTILDAALTGVLKIEPLGDEHLEAKWVVSNIKNLLELKQHNEIEGGISLDRMVVISRNRFIFSALEAELKNEEIPYSLNKGERYEEPGSLFGKVLDYAIRVRLNPKDWVDGKKLCSLLKISPPSNWGGGELLGSWSIAALKSSIKFPVLQSELLDAVEKIDIDEPNVRKLVKIFDEKLKLMASSSDNDEDRDELEHSIAELDDFRRGWTRFKKKGLGDSLQAFRNAMALGQLSEDSVGNGLTLSTVHAMKGLEKDIVFIIGMCEGVFPDYRAKTKDEINEERNSAFVAVTRAKRWLYISYPQRRTMPWGDVRGQVQSRFIGEIQG